MSRVCRAFLAGLKVFPRGSKGVGLAVVHVAVGVLATMGKPVSGD